MISCIIEYVLIGHVLKNVRVIKGTKSMKKILLLLTSILLIQSSLFCAEKADQFIDREYELQKADKEKERKKIAKKSFLKSLK